MYTFSIITRQCLMQSFKLTVIIFVQFFQLKLLSFKYADSNYEYLQSPLLYINASCLLAILLHPRRTYSLALCSEWFALNLCGCLCVKPPL